MGELRNGIYYIMENLMVSRLANSFGALGIARKAYLEAYYYVQKRTAFGRRLVEHPLIRRDLVDMEVSIEGSLALAFKAVDQFERSWKEAPPYSDAYHYARLLTHVTKNVTADMAASVTRTAMEVLGGIGFLREFPVERLHREALITPIWEGPSNIQALDMLEVMAKKQAHLTLLDDMRKTRDKIVRGKDVAELAVRKIEEATARLPALDGERAQFYGKDVLNVLGNGIATVMLLEIGNRSDARFIDVGRLYSLRFLEGKWYGEDAVVGAEKLFAIDR